MFQMLGVKRIERVLPTGMPLTVVGEVCRILSVFFSLLYENFSEIVFVECWIDLSTEADLMKSLILSSVTGMYDRLSRTILEISGFRNLKEGLSTSLLNH